MKYTVGGTSIWTMRTSSWTLDIFVISQPNGVSSIKTQRTNSESQCGKVIHKKSVGKAGNSKNSNFPLSPLIFYVLLSRIDFQSSSVNIIVTEPHCQELSVYLVYLYLSSKANDFTLYFFYRPVHRPP